MSQSAVVTVERREAARRPIRQGRRAGDRVRLLGGDMDLVRPDEVLLHVERQIAAGRKSLVANHNLHSLHLLQRTPALRSFFALADLIEVDSTPLIMFARLLGLPARGFHRCTYLDWRGHFWSLADRHRWRVMYVGGAPGVAETAARRLGGRHPGVEIGVRDGYFDAAAGSADNAAVLDQVSAFRPDVLMVGMGMPRQELWILDHFEALPDCVILPVGAAFDYEAGVQAAAPRWMGRLGLEWLFRLAHDPKRLFVRYCVEPWTLVGPALGDLRRARRRP